MTRRTTMAAMVACVMTVMTFAQETPNFSGTWEMDGDRTRAENRARSAGAAPRGNGAAPAGGVSTMSGGGGGTIGAATLGPAAGAPVATVVKVTQTADTLTVDRVSGQVWEKVVHSLSGTESVSTNGNSTMKLKSRWDGARLVSEGTSETKLRDGSGSIAGTVKEVRWLEKPGVMVIETTRTINDRPNTSVQYFTKK